MTKRSELNFPAIYTITHTASGKVYVGQTINVRIRWQLHRSDLRKGKHRNRYLQAAWNKYGSDAFVFAIHKDMRNVPNNELAKALNQEEITLLSSLEETYNLMEAGQSGTVASEQTKALLKKRRHETWSNPAFREKQRAGIMERYADAEWKAARDAAVKEGKNQPNAKAAVSAQMSALWQTKEHREAMSERRKTNWQDPTYRAQQTVSRSATWDDPEVRRKRSEGIKAAHARRRAAKAANN